MGDFSNDHGRQRERELQKKQQIYFDFSTFITNLTHKQYGRSEQKTFVNLVTLVRFWSFSGPNNLRM